jgi:Arc/MetJ family transcription regulator
VYDFGKSVCLQENIMRTTINIQDGLMEALMAHTKAKTKTKAIELSIREKTLLPLVVKLISIPIGKRWKRLN